MKRIEIELNAINKELEKLEVQLTKRMAALEKKTAKAEKVGMAIAREEFFKVRDNITQEQWSAYFNYSLAQDAVEETKRKIENANKRAEVRMVKFQAYVEQKTQEERDKELAEEISRWAEEGIVVEKMYSNYIIGTTPNGKHFCIDGNNGYTNRSRHCYSVRIGGETVFTSGEFWRAFLTVKNN